MDVNVLNIIEFFLFFVVFGFVFQAFNAFDLSKFFKKNHTWQIQFIYILSTIIFSYLAVKAFMNLIFLSTNIFS